MTLAEILRRGIPVRIVSAGDRLTCGEVTLEVLHPPSSGPPGNENTRSLVLAIRYAGRTILLTGDLEGAGRRRVLNLPPRRVDVMLAPHHGSPRANTPAFADWGRPQVVIASQMRTTAQRPGNLLPGGASISYHRRRRCYHGAFRRGGMVVETFLTKERLVFRNAERTGTGAKD